LIFASFQISTQAEAGMFPKMHAAQSLVRRRFMKMRVYAALIVALAIMALTGCGHYVCGSGPILSGSSCTPGTPGLSTGTGTSTAASAFVFVADATGASATSGTSTTGTIDGYTLSTGASTFTATSSYTAPITPLNDSGVGMVVAQSQYLYTGFGSTDSIYGWTISAAGNLTAISGSPYSASFMHDVGEGVDTTSVITNPAGTLLFFADTLQSEIYVYQIGSGGALTAASGSPFSVALPPGNMATDGLGKYLYITETTTNHTGSKIAAYAIGSSGTLTAVTGSPFVYPMWQVQGEPTGKFLIGTSGHSLAVNGTDDDNLYVFSIGQSGSAAGALTPVSGSPFVTTSSPFNIAVQQNSGGNLVYTFGLEDSDLGFNPAEGYEISSTGSLTAVSGSPFTGVALGTLADFDQSGAYLFVYGAVENSGTNVVTYQMSAIDVASGGALTQPTTTLTLASGGFFAVTDAQ
jgi:hypothetical protein